MTERLLENNRAWVAQRLRDDPNFFQRLSAQQAPEYLWIGCSDSRVPANQITGLDPGEVFVHRNIANVVVHSDLNCLSVLQFAVDVIKVKHVILCGHYGCSGVKAALNGTRVGLVDNWLRHVQDVAEQNESYLGQVVQELRHDRLCELNVLTQVQNICRTSVVREAWERGQELSVHGWIYGVDNGLLTDLGASCSSNDEVNLKLPAAYGKIHRK